MLKKYEQLTEVERKKVQVMYSDQTTVTQYLYNFEDDGTYRGRQFVPSQNVVIDGDTTFVIPSPEEKPTELPESEEKPKRRIRRNK